MLWVSCAQALPESTRTKQAEPAWQGVPGHKGKWTKEDNPCRYRKRVN